MVFWFTASHSTSDLQCTVHIFLDLLHLRIVAGTTGGAGVLAVVLGYMVVLCSSTDNHSDGSCWVCPGSL